MAIPCRKRAFHAPTQHEGEKDGTCPPVWISPEKRLWFLLASWIARENPADRQGWLSKAIPQCRPSPPLPLPRALPIPADHILLPVSGRVNEEVIEPRYSFADHLRLATFGAPFDGRRRFSQDTLLLAGGNQGDLTMRTVNPSHQTVGGSVAHHADLAVWEPAMHDTDHLPCPHGHGFVPLALPAASAKAGAVERTTRKGNAQDCLVHEGVTSTAITIQRSPLLLTDRFRLERALSRYLPRLLICGPHRRCNVSSITMHMQASGAPRVSTISRSTQ